MVYHISLWGKQYVSVLNIMHYVSFRAMAGLLTALCLSLIFGSWFIEQSKKFFRSKSREWAPERHKEKDDMPTMGGIFILMVVVISALTWCNMAKPQVWLFLLCLLSFGLLGFWDDWSKIRTKKGISAKQKFIAQWSIAAMVVIAWVWTTGASTSITFPFLKWFTPNVGLFFIPWAMFVLVAMSNAVNFTDGLDGLAIGSLMPNFIVFSIIAYVAGHAGLAAYLNIPFADSAEIAVLGAILVGASLGFLWYNAHPAQVFMGDVGSLSLGAGLAFMALLAKQELLLVIAGGLFVAEMLSVMLQVFSVKRFGKRIFKMAPLHHHFELLGWHEEKITMRFCIISVVLCLLALMTLKMR